MNPFVGASVEDLERWLRAAQKDLAAGKSASSWSEGDSSSGQFVFPEMAPLRRIELLLKALHIALPDDERYSAENIRRITRTRARFNTVHPGPETLWP